MTYDAKQIKQLEGLEAIRRLPGMYIGNNSVYGLHHILMELIDNAVDEIMNGYDDTITVIIHPDGSAGVADNGRGIPVEYKPDTKVSALTQVLTMLHAGGKFRTDGEQDAYLSGSGGLHGIGIKATNAFSGWLTVEVRRNGVIFRQRFEEGGKPVTGVQIVEPGSDKVVGQIDDRTDLVTDKKGTLTALKIGRKKQPVKPDPQLGTGTSLHFRPHRSWFDEAMEWPRPDKFVPWEFERLETRLQQVAHLHPGLKIELYDRRGAKKDHKKRSFQAQRGLLDYIERLNEGQQPLHKPVHFKGQAGNGAAGDISIEVVLQYAGEETTIVSFVNSIPTPLGGTAVSGFQAGLTKAVNQFGAEKKLLKDGNLRGDDLLLGLTAVVNVTMAKTPQFSSQTKESLTTAEAQGAAMSVTYEHLLAHLARNIPAGKAIIGQAQAAARGREAARAARRLVMRKSALEVDGLPAKLADVQRGADTGQTVLYIVEGDSAGGSCKQARDRRYHAILPLRGKILNTESASMTRMIGSASGRHRGNSEIKAIISALGAGFGPDFNAQEMRYGAVAILVDADVDGAHIRTLLHTLFWRHMKPLVMAGKLYIAMAPLYQLRKGKKAEYVYNDQELDRLLAKWGKDGVTIQRYKGLGEMNPAQLRETVFAVGDNGPFNEHLVQVRIDDDLPRINQVISTLMGSQVAPRREWLLNTWAGEDSRQQEEEE